ncbi:MAG: universal stress protein [Actinomycetota bacterium]|nr:universal stress protein [Actinomycetota bacterium]
MNVVVGFTRSSEGRAALERAKNESRMRGARLVIVHSSRGGSHESAEDAAADTAELERVDLELSTAGIDHEIRKLARGGTPADDVIAVANESDDALIVIGLRRRSRVGKLMLGSNSQDILLQADCAVLAVKPG